MQIGHLSSSLCLRFSSLSITKKDPLFQFYQSRNEMIRYQYAMLILPSIFTPAFFVLRIFSLHSSSQHTIINVCGDYFRFSPNCSFFPINYRTLHALNRKSWYLRCTFSNQASCSLSLLVHYLKRYRNSAEWRMSVDISNVEKTDKDAEETVQYFMIIPSTTNVE